MKFILTAGSLIGPIILFTAAAALVTLILTPIVRYVVVRYDVLDHPDPRRVNTSPIPRGGGIATAAGFVGVAAAFLLINEVTHTVPIPRFLDRAEVIALLLGCLGAAFLGALDDIFDLRARWQLLGQLTLGVFAVTFGISMDYIANPFSATDPQTYIVFSEYSEYLAAIVTVFWIVGMINSINFIDGLDGLSSGIAFIAAVTLGLINLSTQSPSPMIAVLCFILAGALLGFLRWNLHPASIFPGTSGVQFVGYALAVLAILGSAKVAVALLVLGVPIIDTFWIIVRRLFDRRSPFSPDRGHIHHRLLDLGLSHRQTVFAIYGICLALSILALALSGVQQLYAFLGVFLASGLILFVPTRGALRRPEGLEADAYDGPDEHRPG
jgi:UDP-GlcNAc:undecaprenyl-phosphate/decaprenyl-phosphate GlcNAc-1-phosphate transferase